MTGGSPLVFVVDDDPSVRKSLTRLLESSGYLVEVFASAREFLARAVPRPVAPVGLARKPEHPFSADPLIGRSSPRFARRVP